MGAAIATSLNTSAPLNPADQPGLVTGAVTPTFTDAAPTDRSHVQPVAQLYLEEDGSLVPGGIIKWSAIDRPMDGGDFTAELRVGALDGEEVLNPDDTLGEHFAQIIERLRGDKLARIVIPNGDGGEEVLFEGYPLPQTISWTDKAQAVRVTCVSRGQELLRTTGAQQIHGRYMRGTPNAEWDPENPDHRLVTALPAIFNPGGKPNRTANALAMKAGPARGEGTPTQPIYLWTTDDHPSASPWTYVQALRTLLYLWVLQTSAPVKAWPFLADTEALATADPTPLADDPFVARMTRVIDDLAIQSCNVEEAIAVLCHAAGLHYEIAAYSVATSPSRVVGRPLPPGYGTVSHYLRVWASLEHAADVTGSPDKREMGLPAVHDLPRDKPFRNYEDIPPAEIARANAAQMATLTIDPRDVSDARFVGGYEEFEVSLLLRPGWAPHEKLDDIIDSETEQEAREFWDGQFEEEYTHDNNRLPYSVYHAQHPDHADYADVFRTWIFPDDPAYEGMNLGRLTTGNQAVWRAGKYNTHNVATETLWYTHPTYGGGLSAASVANWVPRRRPFRETIGRKNTGTTDRAPIVRIHFGVRGVKTLNDELRVSVQGRTYVIEGASYTLEATEHECSDNSTCRLWCDETEVVQESTTEWPSYEHVKLATVTTSGGEIVSVEAANVNESPEANDPGWVEYTGKVDIDAERGAIHFGEDNIYNAPCFRENPDYDTGDGETGLGIYNYIKGHFFVQVTCTIRGDQRHYRDQSATSHATGSRRRHQVVDLGHERFPIRRRREGNSFLNGLPQDAPAYERRIANELQFEYHAATRSLQMAGATVAGNLEVFYLTAKFKPGDAISGCAGLGLAFDRYPAIERVRYVNEGSGQRTVVTVTDLRHNPELGAGAEG